MSERLLGEDAVIPCVESCVWGGNDFGQLGNGGPPLETAKKQVRMTGF